MKLLVLLAICGLGLAAPTEHDSLSYVDDILRDSYEGSSILDTLSGAFNRQLDQAEHLIRTSGNEDIIGKDEIPELRNKIQNAGSLSMLVNDVLPEYRRIIDHIYTELNRRLDATENSSKAAPYQTLSQLREIFLQIKKWITSPEGIAEVREYIQSLKGEHPVIFLIKAAVETMTEEDMLEIAEELLSEIQNSYESYVIENSSLDDPLENLFTTAWKVLNTDEGLLIVKRYFRRLQTRHPIVAQVRDYVLSAENDVLREILAALMGGFEHQQNYEVTTELGSLFVRIKQIILSRNDGLAVIREYAHQKLASTHPIVELIQRYLRYSGDDELKELFSELFKDLGYFYGVYDTTSDLKDLFLQVRKIVDSDQGLQLVKAYALNLETSHPIALRIKNFFSNASEDDVREALDALFGGLNYNVL